MTDVDDDDDETLTQHIQHALTPSSTKTDFWLGGARSAPRPWTYKLFSINSSQPIHNVCLLNRTTVRIIKYGIYQP